MRRLIPFLLVAGFVLFSGAGIRGWMTWRAAHPWWGHELVELDALDAAELKHPVVRLHGTAHLSVVIRQRVGGTLFDAERELYVYGLFPTGDTESREVRILVRTERKPPPRVDFEDAVMEGRLYPATQERLPFGTDIEVGKRSDYWFEDNVLIFEPWRIVADGVEWTASNVPENG